MKQRKKYLSGVLAFLLVFTMVFSLTTPVARAEEETVITIYHTNDMHSSVADLSYVKSLKESTPNSLLVDAGDATQGAALATYTKGSAIIKMMNAVGYDAMTLGNHEFDYGSETAVQNAGAANFPVVSANVLKPEGTPLLKGINGNNGCYVIKEVAGKRIGIFGLTTTETAYKTNPNNLNGITFANEIETAKAQVAALQAEGVDAIIALMHVGNDASSNPTSLQIGEAVEGIDVIIDGHSHTVIQTTLPNGTLVAQTGTALANLGKVTLTFKDGAVSASCELINKEAVEAGTTDETVSSLFNSLTEELKPVLEKVIGNTSTDLIANAADGTRICRIQETSMGDLVADSMVWGAKSLISGTAYENLPVVALENGGGVRANITAGDITVEDALTVLPFGNMISVKVVTPQILYNTMENGICKMTVNEKGEVDGLDGRFPQISGMRIEIDLTKTAYDPENPANGTGQRVTAVYLVDENGKETLLDRNDTTTEIALASNDFEIAGGDGYIMLSNLKHIAEGSVLDSVFADYITKLTTEQGGSFTYKAAGNRTQVVKTAEAQITNVPKTGDSSMAAVYAAAMAMAAAAAVMVLRKKEGSR